jgi:hypothetical protein
MAARWADGFDTSLIATYLNRFTTVDPDGNLSFRTFGHQELISLLDAMVDCRPAIAHIDKQLILNQAMVNARRKGDITPRSLIQQIQRLEQRFQQLPDKELVLLTTISLKMTSELRPIRFEGCHIKFPPKILPTFEKARAELKDKAKHTIRGEHPSDYRWVTMNVRAKTAFQAIQSGMDKLDLFRGLLNFFHHWGRHRLTVGYPKPVNEIVLGPFHTVHDDSGASAAEVWWFQPDYVGPVAPVDPLAKGKNPFPSIKKARERLRKHPYAKVVEEALIRYVRALDQRDFENAFINLWGVLEHLTDTSWKNNQLTERRAGFLLGNDHFYREVLRHLRSHRNRSVHAGANSEFIETLVYQLKRVVEEHLRFHLFQGWRFGSHAETAEFMDLPIQSDALRARIAKSKLALRYFQPHQKSSIGQ